MCINQKPAHTHTLHAHRKKKKKKTFLLFGGGGQGSLGGGIAGFTGRLGVPVVHRSKDDTCRRRHRHQSPVGRYRDDSAGQCLCRQRQGAWITSHRGHPVLHMHRILYPAKVLCSLSSALAGACAYPIAMFTGTAFNLTSCPVDELPSSVLPKSFTSLSVQCYSRA